MTPPSQTMRDAFISGLIPVMKERDDIFFISADLGAPALDELRRLFPDRFINVGIAEQNLINVATGLALEGASVYCFAIAPFISMRCYEQVRVNLALMTQVRPLNVTLIGVGAGASYDMSGPSHQALEDLSIMRTLPNVTVLSPSDAASARALLGYTLSAPGPKYLRLDSKPLPPVYAESSRVPVEAGFSERASGDGVCLVTTGYMTGRVARLIQEHALRVGHIDMFNLTRFNATTLSATLDRYRAIVTAEEALVGRGGLDALVHNLLANRPTPALFRALGYTRYLFEYGDREYLREKAGLGDPHILEALSSVNE